MSAIRDLVRGICLITTVVLLAGCVVAPGGGPGYHHEYREGYYDRDHHRYWHDHGWHDCDRDDPHCH